MHALIPEVNANDITITKDQLFNTFIDKIIWLCCKHAENNRAFNPPLTITTDHKLESLVKVFRIRFAQTKIRVCFHHFCRSILDSVSTANLHSQYQSDPNFAFRIWILIATAFVPPDTIDQHYRLLTETMFASPLFDSILVEYEDQWLGRPTFSLNRKRPSKYPIDSWNLYDHLLSNYPVACVRQWPALFQQHQSQMNTTVNFWQVLNCLKRDLTQNASKIDLHLSRITDDKPIDSANQPDKFTAIRSIVQNYDPIHSNVLYLFRDIAQVLFEDNNC